MDEKHWEAICALARGVDWNGEVPKIGWDLRIAIGSLVAQRAKLWDYPEVIPQLLDENPGVAEIFARYNETAIAYTFRLARYAEAR